MSHRVLLLLAGIALAGESGEPPLAPSEEPRAELPAPAIPAPETRLLASLEAALQRETERAEEALEALESVERELEARGAAVIAETDGAAARAAELEAARLLVPGPSAEGDRLYGSIVAELGPVRAALDAALDAQGRPPEVGAFTLELDPARIEVPAVRAQAELLVELAERLARQAARLRDVERSQRAAAVDRWAEAARRLDTVRIDTLPLLTDARRTAILGFNREGFAQLGREVRQLRLMARTYLGQRREELARLPALGGDLLALGGTLLVLLRLSLVAGLVGLVASQSRGWFEAARRGLLRSTRGVKARRRAVRLLGAARAVWPAVLVLATIAGLDWALGHLAQVPEVRLVLRLALVYGLYRLAVDVLTSAILAAARTYRLVVDEGRTALVLWSVRTASRVVVAIVVLLVITASLVGRGYLYHLVVRLGWIVALVAGFILLLAWREPIVETYLRYERAGEADRLRQLVIHGRGRWYGVFVAAAASTWLAGRALAVLGRDFAMGFDQTRRGLAFLFRRRMERHAARTGYAAGDIAALPPSVVRAFTEEPVDDDSLLVDHFPGLERLESLLASWREGDLPGSFLLTGERGNGKTSWLARLGGAGLPVARITLADRELEPDGLARRLAAELALGPVAGMAELHRALADGARRVVVVDLAQNLFLGAVGGYRAFDAFVDLVQATARRTFWICAFSEPSWDHLSAARADPGVFRDRQRLAPWSEERIRELIDTRLAASGVTPRYDDLLVDRFDRMTLEERLLDAREGYARLLWDHADGNPRVALHYLLRSLVPLSDGQVRVRMFRAPPPAELDGFGSEAQFILAAIIMHENLTHEEATRVTRYPARRSEVHLARLLEHGTLRCTGGRYRVTSHWHRAVVRMLRHKNLLTS